MISEEVVTTAHMESIWTLVKKGDAETRQNIYKIFKDLTTSLNFQQTSFILKHISEGDLNELTKDEIELIYEITRFSTKSEKIAVPAVEFLWEVVCGLRSAGVSVPVLDYALSKLGDLLKCWALKEHRLPVIQKCLENIKNNISVIQSLKILNKTIESFPIKDPGTEIYTQSMIMEELCGPKYDVLKTLLDSLKLFKQRVLSKIEGTHEHLTETQVDALVGDRVGYMEQISERINFLKTVIKILNESSGRSASTTTSSSKNEKEGSSINIADNIILTLTLSQAVEIETQEAAVKKPSISVFNLLSSLWSDLVTESLIPAERDIMFKWLREFAETNRENIEEVSKFFIDKVVGDDNQILKITFEGFNCFKGLFINLNHKSNKLHKQERVRAI